MNIKINQRSHAVPYEQNPMATLHAPLWLFHIHSGQSHPVDCDLMEPESVLS